MCRMKKKVISGECSNEGTGNKARDLFHQLVPFQGFSLGGGECFLLFDVRQTATGSSSTSHQALLWNANDTNKQRAKCS